MERDCERALAVWQVDVDGGAEALDALNAELGLVPPLRAARQPDTAIEQPKQRARVALRALLAGYVGLERARAPFVVAAGGKPALAVASSSAEACPELQFSLAHSGSWAIIGLSTRGAIGVDVEPERAVRINAGRRAMLEHAAAALSPGQPLPSEPPDRRFVQAWVRLEALAKASGEGVGSLLGRIREDPATGLASLVGGDADAPCLVVRDLAWPGPGVAHAAVAASPAALDSATPPPAIVAMPLDPAWLRDWLASPGQRPRTT